MDAPPAEVEPEDAEGGPLEPWDELCPGEGKLLEELLLDELWLAGDGKLLAEREEDDEEDGIGTDGVPCELELELLD